MDVLAEVPARQEGSGERRVVRETFGVAVHQPVPEGRPEALGQPQSADVQVGQLAIGIRRAVPRQTRTRVRRPVEHHQAHLAFG